MKVLFLAAGAAATTLAVVAGPGAVGAALAARAAPLAAVTATAGAGPGFYPGTPMALAAGSPSAVAPGVASAAALAARSEIRSRNWAGYAVTGGRARFQSVQATFFVPYLDCTRSGSSKTYSSHWVGLDGYSSSTVEQDGIAADCIGGRAKYYSWYEMFPKFEQPTGLAVRPGDAVTAVVRYSASSRKFELSLTDHATGRRFAVSQRCPHGATCARTSAEVISEAPATVQSGRLVLLPLADYQAAEFTAIGMTQGGGISGGISSSHWQATKIIQVRATDNSVILARPTPVHADVFANYWARQR